MVYIFLPHQMDSGEVKPKSGMGVAVSTMGVHGDDLEDDQKSVFDWCKDGDVARVKKILHGDGVDVHVTDEDVSGGNERTALASGTPLLNNVAGVILHFIASCVGSVFSSAKLSILYGYARYYMYRVLLFV